jgi:DNA-binding transcriptional regulator YhcF (GntR family)
MPDGFADICKKHVEGLISTRAAAEQLGVSHTTFCRRYQQWKKHSITASKNVSDSRLLETSAV